MTDETTPEDVADVLWLGVMEQGIARLPALCEAVARAVPAGADPVAEDDVLGESVAAGFAVALLHLEKRLSPEDLHRLHLAIESRADRMDPSLAHHVWRYYYALGGESGEAMLRALGREFRAKCYQRDPGALPDDPRADLSLAELLVPRGTAAVAVDIGRLLRRAGMNRQGQG